MISFCWMVEENRFGAFGPLSVEWSLDVEIILIKLFIILIKLCDTLLMARTLWTVCVFGGHSHTQINYTMMMRSRRGRHWHIIL